MSSEVLGSLCTRYDIHLDQPGNSYLPSGWAKLVEDLIVELVALGWERKLFQCKEKMGGLRFYIEGTTEQQRVVSMAERASFSVCVSCGKSASLKEERGVYRTKCAACATKLDFHLT